MSALPLGQWPGRGWTQQLQGRAVGGACGWDVVSVISWFPWEAGPAASPLAEPLAVVSRSKIFRLLLPGPASCKQAQLHSLLVPVSMGLGLRQGE